MTGKMLTTRLLSTAIIILAVVIAKPVLASPAMAIRTLPASVDSGIKFDVTLEASGCGTFGQLVETLPPGFTYLGCHSDDIGVSQAGNTVKFTFIGDSSTFTYSVKAPIVPITTIYTFRGIAKDENKDDYLIQDKKQ